MRERPGGSGCCGGRGDHFGPSARWRSVPPRPHRAAERGARPSRRETRALPSPHWARAAVLAPVRTPPARPCCPRGAECGLHRGGAASPSRDQARAAPCCASHGPPTGCWVEGGVRAGGAPPAAGRRCGRASGPQRALRLAGAREEPTAHPALSLQLESLAHHQEGDTRGRQSPPAPVKEPGLSPGGLARGARGLGMFSRPAFRSHV